MAARERSRRGLSRPHPVGGGSLLANLAAQPFVNKRPVQRFVMAAWALSAVLVGINIALWVNYRHESTSLRARLVSTRAEIETKSKSVVEMDRQLRMLRLGAQNAQVAFLNARIAERTFPWSLLFERIAATLPDGVRLKSLNPVFTSPDAKSSPAERARRGSKAKAKGSATGAATAPPEELIHLTLAGSAKSDESLYQLVDALFASPSFASPRLHQENNTGAEVEFTVDVDYRPRFNPESSHRPAVAGEGETADGESGDEETSDEEMAADDSADETGAGDADAEAGDAGGDVADGGGEEDENQAPATRSSQSDDERKRALAANAGPRRRPTTASPRAPTRDRSDPEDGE